jgi:hypothetical protein
MNVRLDRGSVASKLAAESLHRRHRYLLLEIFVASVRKNSGGELVIGWFPLNAPIQIYDMNLITSTPKPSRCMSLLDRGGQRVPFLLVDTADL